MRKAWRDAATLILAARNSVPENHLHNRSSFDYKVLMLKRSSKSTFMANAYVFPGGVTASVDWKKDWLEVFNRCNMQRERFNNMLHIEGSRAPLYASNIGPGILGPELAFRINALRETFEESGVLLIRNPDGSSRVLAHPNEKVGDKQRTLEEWRAKVNEDANMFFEMFRSVPVAPDVWSLYEWSTWLTPVMEKHRFDTLFYIAFIESISYIKEDCQEIIDSVWKSPDDVLTRLCRKEFRLFPPQLIELLRMRRFKQLDLLRQFATDRERHGLEFWCPHGQMCTDGFVVTYPGDDSYCADPFKEPATVSMTREEHKLSCRNVNRQDWTGDLADFNVSSNVSWCGHAPIGDVSSEHFRALGSRL